MLGINVNETDVINGQLDKHGASETKETKKCITCFKQQEDMKSMFLNLAFLGKDLQLMCKVPVIFKNNVNKDFFMSSF